MKTLELSRRALNVCSVAAVLAGCSGNPAYPNAPLSADLTGRRLDAPLPLKAAPTFLAADVFGVYGYPDPNKVNQPPTCTLPLYGAVGAASDSQGNYIVPAYAKTRSHRVVYVYEAGTCGTLLASLEIKGLAFAAASSDVHTRIVVGVERKLGRQSAGAIVVCSLTHCGAPITSSNVTGGGEGVAVAKNGDCWMSGLTHGRNGSPVLAYWPSCTGAGEAATGFQNTSSAGLFVDTRGNLGAFDTNNDSLYVYSGCNPACRLVSKTRLEGQSFFGNLNAKGDELVAGDSSFVQCDVYSYRPTGSRFRYSFNNGLEGRYLTFCISAASGD